MSCAVLLFSIILPYFITTSTVCRKCQKSIGTKWMALCRYNIQSVSHTGLTQCAHYQYCTHPKFHVSTVHVCTYTYVSIGQSAIIKSTSSSLDNSVQAAHHHIENTCPTGMDVLLKCFFSESPNKDFIVFSSSAVVSGQLRWWLLQEDPV